MSPKWSFRRMDRGELNVDPIQREFFTTEALEGGLAEALVREAIQNSLDAAKEGRKVRVRFWLSGAGQGAAEDVGRFFVGLSDHLGAEGSGLRHLPDQEGTVPYLVIEDFETTGLRGDSKQEQDVQQGQRKNDFYYFWRNVGRSGKAERDRGRWGLGKTVFPAASRINTFFGLTVREESPERLLMGQSVLKVHELDGARHYPYGYFGLIDEEDGFAMPVDQQTVLAEFAARFSLKRRTEPGLSTVIPFPHDEISEELLLEAVIRQYFYAILSGALVATVGSGGTDCELDDSSLMQVVGRFHGAFGQELMPLLKLAEWACNEGQGVLVQMKPLPADTTPKWTRDALQAEQVPDLRTRFERGEPLAFRVPVWVRPEDEAPKETFFDVFLQRDLTMKSHQPRFIREGIIVADAVKRKRDGLYALVVIEDKPLATLLGDAENPAHTEWQERSANFRDRYQQGASVLRFVKNSVAELVQLISFSEEEADPKALADIFFLPEALDSEETRKEPVEVPRPGTQTVPPVIGAGGKRENIRVSRVSGGFSVSHRDAAEALPDRIEIRTAYEVRRGNAFKRYQPADFELDKPPITISTESAAVAETELNRLALHNLKPGFRVTVLGFDVERDLVVRAVGSEPEQEGSDDSQI